MGGQKILTRVYARDTCGQTCQTLPDLTFEVWQQKLSNSQYGTNSGICQTCQTLPDLKSQVWQQKLSSFVPIVENCQTAKPTLLNSLKIIIYK